MASMGDDVMCSPSIGLEIPVFETSATCAGAAASYVLRRIAYRAGTFAPGIQDAIFHELHRQRDGETIADVARWCTGRRSALDALGYRLACRRMSIATCDLVDWIEDGRGYRGAVVTTAIGRVIGVSVERSDPDGDDELVIVDPTRPSHDARRWAAPWLERELPDNDHLALGLFWMGWS